MTKCSACEKRATKYSDKEREKCTDNEWLQQSSPGATLIQHALNAYIQKAFPKPCNAASRFIFSALFHTTRCNDLPSACGWNLFSTTTSYRFSTTTSCLRSKRIAENIRSKPLAAEQLPFLFLLLEKLFPFSFLFWAKISLLQTIIKEKASRTALLRATRSVQRKLSKIHGCRQPHNYGPAMQCDLSKSAIPNLTVAVIEKTLDCKPRWRQ